MKENNISRARVRVRFSFTHKFLSPGSVFAESSRREEFNARGSRRDGKEAARISIRRQADLDRRFFASDIDDFTQIAHYRARRSTEFRASR
jgi:hypothetical protein